MVVVVVVAVVQVRVLERGSVVAVALLVSVVSVVTMAQG